MSSKTYYPAQKNPIVDAPVVTLEMADLSPLYDGHIMVVRKVKESIPEVGFINPIVVIPHELIACKLAIYRDKSDNVRMDAPYYIYTGNNRYYAAKSLGITKIDAVIAPSRDVLKDWEAKMHINYRFYREVALGLPY